MKRLILATLIAASSVVVFPTQALAQVSVNIVIGDAPPPPRYEVVPGPRRGYVWAPGYWNWNGSRHVWSGGHWERARSGYYYTRPEWRQGGDGWRLERGGWKAGKHDGGGRDFREHDNGKHRGSDRGDDRHHGKHKDHCPPGQAKKGNC